MLCGLFVGVAVSGTYNEGQGNIVLDNVECNGTERILSECKNPGINYHNCDHSEDAGVRCFSKLLFFSLVSFIPLYVFNSLSIMPGAVSDFM